MNNLSNKLDNLTVRILIGIFFLLPITLFMSFVFGLPALFHNYAMIAMIPLRGMDSVRDLFFNVYGLINIFGLLGIIGLWIRIFGQHTNFSAKKRKITIIFLTCGIIYSFTMFFFVTLMTNAIFISIALVQKLFIVATPKIEELPSE